MKGHPTTSVRDTLHPTEASVSVSSSNNHLLHIEMCFGHFSDTCKIKNHVKNYNYLFSKGFFGGRYRVRTCDPCRVKAEKYCPEASIGLLFINKIK